MPDTLLATIKEFQSLFVGIIGFGGVMLTIWLNASQARKQRQDERQHNRATLRTALIAELKIHRNSIDENRDRNDGISESTGYVVPTDPMDDVYRAFTPRIGLLSREEVRKVLLAYLSIRAYHAKLFLIGVPFQTGDRNIHIPSKNGSYLFAMQEGLTGPIEMAIEELERANAA